MPCGITRRHDETGAPHIRGRLRRVELIGRIHVAGRAPECTGFEPTGGLARGAPSRPLRSRSYFRSVTSTASTACVPAGRCKLLPPTATRRVARALRPRRPAWQSSPAQSASPSTWRGQRCRRPCPHGARRSWPAGCGLRLLPTQPPRRWRIGASRPGRHRRPDLADRPATGVPTIHGVTSRHIHSQPVRDRIREPIGPAGCGVG